MKHFFFISLSLLCASLSDAHNIAYHEIESLSKPLTIRLENGSEWSYDAAQSELVLTWEEGDVVSLSPKQELLNSADTDTYLLTNQSLNFRTEVTSSIGPTPFGSSSDWILGIDPDLGLVYLTNIKDQRTTWMVSGKDLYLLKSWQLNQHVIGGINDNWLWWFSSYDTILINTELRQFIRVKKSY